MKAQKETRPYFSLLLSIKHPSMDPTVITQELGMEPFNSWLAGKERRTPIGTQLPGANKISFWTTREESVGDRLFFECMLDMIRRLESSSNFLRIITSTGEIITLVIHLPGRVNIGDEIAASDLVRLGRLNINLGVEVFPNYGELR